MSDLQSLWRPPFFAFELSPLVLAIAFSFRRSVFFLGGRLVSWVIVFSLGRSSFSFPVAFSVELSPFVGVLPTNRSSFPFYGHLLL